jgi:hypothetical protein
MSTILFLSGETMGDALGSSGRSLRGVFEPLGHNLVEVRLSSPDWMGLISKTVATDSVAFAFSHVGMGADLTAQAPENRPVNFWTGNAIPFISFFGDSPAYFFDRHVSPGYGFAYLYAFPEHYLLRKALPRTNALLGVTPLRLIDDTPREEIDFRLKETGKLLFLKNGNDPDKLVNTWRSTLPLSIFLVLMDLASVLLEQLGKDSGCDIDGVVRSYFHDKGLDIAESTSLRLFFIAQLDDYLRRVKSTSMAEVLKKFPVEIRGYNWEHVDFSRCRADYIPGGDYTASKELIKRALGVIDMSPNTSLRPHDRPLRAFGLYTLCITNEQTFFREHFPDRCSSFSFRFEKDSLEETIENVLARPRDFVELGIEVAESFRNQIDGMAFGRTILEIADCLRLGMGSGIAGLQNFFVWPPRKLL